MAKSSCLSASPSMTCVLCTSQSAKVSKPLTWIVENAKSIVKKYNVSDDQLVCQACMGDIRREIQYPDHVPRWEKQPKK